MLTDRNGLLSRVQPFRTNKVRRIFRVIGHPFKSTLFKIPTTNPHEWWCALSIPLRVISPVLIDVTVDHILVWLSTGVVRAKAIGNKRLSLIRSR